MNKITAKPTIIFKVIGETLFLYGLLGWIYGTSIQFIHPEWLPLPLSHLTLWLRTDTFTIASFFISAIGFFLWRTSKELQK
jgi:hypothetical protein